MKARLLAYMGMGVASLAGPASGEPWSIQPQLGVSTDYSSNPELRSVDPVSETHVAGLFNMPLRYDDDGEEFSLTPSGRITDSKGYSSLASNSIHIDSAAQFASDIDIASLQAGVSRGSTLYSTGLVAYGYGIGVRRDTENMAADWTRVVTERFQAQVDAGWSHVTYAQPANVTSLVDYRYSSAGPTLSYAVTERDTAKLLANIGLYQSLDGITESKSETAQAGYVRRLTEIWGLSANVGYSQSRNSLKFFFGPFYLGTLNSKQDGTVYSVNLTRTGERLSLNAGVSQALQPTGFAYLSRQDSVALNAAYAESERWNFSLNGAWQKESDPIRIGETIHLRYLNLQATASYSLTPQWVLSLHVSRNSREYGPPSVSANSTGVSLDIVRQFLRTDL